MMTLYSYNNNAGDPILLLGRPHCYEVGLKELFLGLIVFINE
jgi:hypothetical protein